MNSSFSMQSSRIPGEVTRAHQEAAVVRIAAGAEERLFHGAASRHACCGSARLRAGAARADRVESRAAEGVRQLPAPFERECAVHHAAKDCDVLGRGRLFTDGERRDGRDVRRFRRPSHLRKIERRVVGNIRMRGVAEGNGLGFSPRGRSWRPPGVRATLGWLFVARRQSRRRRNSPAQTTDKRRRNHAWSRRGSHWFRQFMRLWNTARNPSWRQHERPWHRVGVHVAQRAVDG